MKAVYLESKKSRVNRVAFFEMGVHIGGLNIEQSGHFFIIWNFIILPEWRGKGWGYKALISVVEKYREENLLLFVMKDNYVAIGLYEKAGFEITHDTPNSIYYKMTLINNP